MIFAFFLLLLAGAALQEHGPDARQNLQLILPSDPAIIYSPFNWEVTANATSTINGGAYFRTLFSGNSCVLKFDVAQMVSPVSQIYYRVDNGPLTLVSVAASVATVIPPITHANPDITFHFLEVIVKSTTERANRWLANQPSTKVIFAGLYLDALAKVFPVQAASTNVLIYGDSITEGVRTLGESAANDTDFDDSTMSYAFALRALLGVEMGVVAFGASGLSRGGSGNVPPTGQSWNLHFEGAPRAFKPIPDLIVTNLGTNDGSVNIVPQMTALLNDLIATCPGRPIAVLRPFNGGQASNLQLAIAACTQPSTCHYIDTTNFFNLQLGTDSMKLHPSGPNSIARIGPAVATTLRPLLR